MLKENNLVLRPIIKSDIEFLNKWKNTEEIFKYLGGGYSPVSIDQQITWIENIIKIDNVNKRFIIEFENKPIGMIGLYNINNINQNCEIGMYIGEKSYQGKGLATKAYQILENYAKKYLNLKKIKLYLVVENIKAKKLWEKLSFIQVGLLKAERYIDGEFKDVAIMEKFLD